MSENNQTKPVISKRAFKIIDLVNLMVVAVTVILLVTSLVYFAVVPSESMLPTLDVGEILLYRSYPKDLDYDDIVIFSEEPMEKRFPGILENFYIKATGTQMIVKRVVGLPGDTIEISRGNLIRNGEVVTADYTLEQEIVGNMKEVTVPDGCLWLMGDNRNNSLDSRYIGAIPVDQVLGRVFFHFSL